MITMIFQVLLVTLGISAATILYPKSVPTLVRVKSQRRGR